MAIIVYINGVDKTSNLSKNSLRIIKKSDHLNSLQLSFNCQASVWMPKNGQDIQVYDGATRLFGGMINNISMEKQEPKRGGACYVKVDVQSNGYNHIPARRTVTVYYENWTAGDIFTNLVDNVLNNASYDENITKGSITSGATYPMYNGFCKSVKDIFDDMARQSGCKWYIDDSKTINFISEDTITTADHTIDESASFTDYHDLRVSTSLDNYCNKVFVKGSADDNYITAVNTSEITLRASAEGTAYSSGVYGRVLQAQDVSDTSNLTAIGDNELKKYGFEPQQLSFRSFTSTWTAGTKIQVNLPAFGITANTSFLIDEIDIWRYDTDILAYDVHCTKRNDSDFSTQREAGGYDFINDLVLASRSEGATGAVYSGAIKHCQATNTATVTVTTSETVVATKSFYTPYPSDIHITFSAHIVATASITVTAKTYLQEGAATAARSYQPIQDLSADMTFTYCEQIASVSAGTSVITVKLVGDTGTMTITANQSALNIIAFPLDVSETATANVTYETITEIDSLEHDTANGSHNSLVMIDAAHSILAYNTSGYDSRLKTFSVDGAYDNITQIDSLIHDADINQRYSLAKIDATHFILAYEDLTGGDKGYLKTFSIDGAYDNITQIDSLNHAVTADHNSLIQIDATHFMLAYSDTTSTQGHISTFSIDGAYAITELNTLQHETAWCTFNSLIMLDSTHFILAYTGTDSDGYIKTFSIDGTYAITELDSLEHDTANGTYSSLAKIDATHFILAYAGTDNDGFIKTFSVDGSYNITQIDSLEHDTSNNVYNSLVNIDNIHFILAYAGFDNDGYISTFSIDGAYKITKLGTLEHDTSYCIYNSLIKLDATHFMLAYGGVDDDGFIKTFVVS